MCGVMCKLYDCENFEMQAAVLWYIHTVEKVIWVQRVWDGVGSVVSLETGHRFNDVFQNKVSTHTHTLISGYGSHSFSVFLPSSNLFFSLSFTYFPYFHSVKPFAKKDLMT